jgi:hypothetical protein
MPDDDPEESKRIRRLEAEVAILKEQFEELRQHLDDEAVFAFVADFTQVKRDKLTPSTTLVGDLKIAGLDGLDLMKAFGKRFGVDLSRFDWSRHFGDEGSANPFLLVWFVCRRLFSEKKTPEAAGGLQPIRISDLILAARQKKWYQRPPTVSSYRR